VAGSAVDDLREARDVIAGAELNELSETLGMARNAAFLFVP